MEDHHIDGRIFRRFSDGRLGEVASDGTVIECFSVGGQHFDSGSATLDEIKNAAHSNDNQADNVDYTHMDEAKPSVSDSRLGKFKTNHSGFRKKSISEIFDDTQKSHSIGGSHSLGGGHDMSSGKGLIDKKGGFCDFFKNKAGTFSEHREKVQSKYDLFNSSNPFQNKSRPLMKKTAKK
jgi:hypothetical protein